MYSIMSSANGDNLISFPFWIPFTLFSSPIVIARTSKTVLNNSDVSGHPCLVPEIREKAFSFSPLSVLLAVGDRDIGVWPVL